MVAAVRLRDEESRLAKRLERGRHRGDRGQDGSSPKEFLLERIVKPARACGEGLPDAAHGRVEVQLALADAAGERSFTGPPERVQVRVGRRGGETRPHARR